MRQVFNFYKKRVVAGLEVDFSMEDKLGCVCGREVCASFDKCLPVIN
jgi:hypothetical protein